MSCVFPLLTAQRSCTAPLPEETGAAWGKAGAFLTGVLEMVGALKYNK